MSWQAVRGVARRVAALCLGPRGEYVAHVTYHRLLRRIDCFPVHESEACRAALRALSRTANTVIDIGANVGRYAWLFARSGPPGRGIYAFEPMPAAFALLTANLRDMPGVACLPLALGAAEGVMTLHVPRDRFGNLNSGTGWIGDARPARDDVVWEVAVSPLDRLVERGSVEIRAPLFVKVDVEGFEYQALSGARETLRRFRPVVYFECQPWALARAGVEPRVLWDFLAREGYGIVAERNGRFEAAPSVDGNVLNYFAIPNAPHTGPWTSEEFIRLLGTLPHV